MSSYGTDERIRFAAYNVIDDLYLLDQTFRCDSKDVRSRISELSLRCLLRRTLRDRADLLEQTGHEDRAKHNIPSVPSHVGQGYMASSSIKLLLLHADTILTGFRSYTQAVSWRPQLRCRGFDARRLLIRRDDIANWWQTLPAVDRHRLRAGVDAEFHTVALSGRPWPAWASG